ncbi:MAG: c-type cytochrome [Myxococcaceae bacterium]
MNRWTAVGGALGLMLVGCQSGTKTAVPNVPADQPTAAAAVAPSAPVNDAKAAEEMFGSRCSPCHGPQGKGDGPASAGLVPKPANFVSAEWQAKVTDEHIEKIILYGGSAVGRAATMPPNPDLDAKPGLVRALRAHIRGLK